MTASLDPDTLTADVLVVGGGPAGAWSAWSAASAGARVVLAEKGYVGSSGATAAGGTNVLNVPPDPELREAAVRARMEAGGHLCEPAWIHRVIDRVHESLTQIEAWGYPFVRDDEGNPVRTHLQGPEYMRLMRKVLQRQRVTILDQSPALELLIDGDGVGGARGVTRTTGRPWEIRSSSVILATGGAAFLSKGLGCNVLTGEGLLMAAEAGAELSSMEFNRDYAMSAAFGTVTRNAMFRWATFTDEEGHDLGDLSGGRDKMAAALLRGPVYAVLDRAPDARVRDMMRRAHAVFFLPYDRAGIDPFTQRFPVTLRYEGTVRGIGGVRLLAGDCSTTLPGLYAAGDAASREHTHGAATGGGAFNAGWAIGSGQWAGAAAALHAREVGPRARVHLRSAGGAGVRGTGPGLPVESTVTAVQRDVLPLEVSWVRSVPVLEGALRRLDDLWEVVRDRPPGAPEEQVHARQAAALVAAARWMHTASLTRTETRGLHSLAEHPDLDPRQRHRLVLSGIDQIAVHAEAIPA